MKKIFLLLCLLPLLSLSQEQDEGQFAIDLPVGYYSNFKSWREEGVSGGVEVSYLKNNFVYGGGIFIGFGISTNKINNDGYIQAQLEIDFLFGRKYQLTPKISVIPQVGIGYIHLTNHYQGDPENLFGVPIQAKLYLHEGKRFAFGIVPRAKLNKTQNIYSAGITLQFKL
ncbi:MAG: hypothetical protein EOO46_06995 [Flavobacterium sp.]|nr:MAG: hypothetical protein EOO46_06995 [Flavobacterium sp.]